MEDRAPRTRSPRWLRQPVDLFFLGLALAHLVPVWAFTYFPSQDGPSHLENARILLDYERPEGAILREFYRINPEPVPNWTSHAVLAGLMSALPPLLAEKVLLSGYLLLLPFAFRQVVVTLRGEATAGVLLAFPLLYNHFLHLGYYNLALSLIAFLFLLAYWLKHESSLGPRRALVLGLLVLVLYFCHLVGLVLGLAALGLLAAAATVTDLRAGAARRAAGRALALLAASAPALLLAARFLSRRGQVVLEPGPSLLDRWDELCRFHELMSYDARELWFSSALAAVLLGASLFALARKRRRRDWGRADRLLLVTAGFLAVYFTVPVARLLSPGSSEGGGTIHDRVSLFVFLALALWLAVQRLGLVARRVIVGLAVVTGLGLVAFRFPKYAELNGQLAEFVSPAPLVAEGTTLLPISYAPDGRGPDGRVLCLRALPFLHAAGYIASERVVVEYTNYEADLGYFPTVFREETNPYRALRWGVEVLPPCPDFPRYARRKLPPIDYVLVWSGRLANPAHPCVQETRAHLARDYDLVFTSSPRGLAELFRRKAFPGPP